MLRSLAAIIIATIAGLALARFVEAAGLAMAGVAENSQGGAQSFTPAYQAVLIASWFIGAFAAAAAALLIGGRWRPLGWLAAVTMFIAAIIAISNASSGFLLWIGALLSTLAGGYLAIKLLGADADYPANHRKKEFFND